MFAISNEKISSEQENIVRKYVVTNYFDVEKIIEHLNANPIVEKDIFTSCLTEEGAKTITFTYLKEYKPLMREIFIRRIPIYFFNLKINDNKFNAIHDMSDLFKTYAKFIKNKNENSCENESLFNTVFEHKNVGDDIFAGVDYEPLYSILEKIMYIYKLDLRKSFEYIVDQFGYLDYKFFSKWDKYLGLLQFIDNDNPYPHNLLYAYNIQLERIGKNPIIYLPDEYKVITGNNGIKRIIFRGSFPFDENNNLIERWIGVWTENVGEMHLRTKAIEGLDYKEIPLDIVKKLSAVLFNQFFITLQEDSLVFIGKESIEEFDDLFSTSYVVNNFWEQIYVGAKRTLFDSAIISKTREKNGISQKEMAEKIDVNLRTFQRIESGESTPDGLNLIKIM